MNSKKIIFYAKLGLSLIFLITSSIGCLELPGSSASSGPVPDTSIDNPMITWYADVDGDEFGDPGTTQESSTQPAGYVLDNSDCDDNDSKAYPGQIWYKDSDDDNYSDGIKNESSCTRPSGYKTASELTVTSGDCDDNDSTKYPGYETWWKDSDNDNYSDGTSDTSTCGRPTGYKTTSELSGTTGDCDDNDSTKYPGYETWWIDADNDYYSNGWSDTTSCERPIGYKTAAELTATSGDCDDNDPTTPQTKLLIDGSTADDYLASGYNISTWGQRAAATDLVATNAVHFNDLSGAVYIFEKENDEWTQQKISPEENSGQEFGIDVEILSSHMMAISDPFFNDPPNIAGVVHLYVKYENSWEKSDFFMFSPSDSNDYQAFGIDLDRYENYFAIGAGFAVYIFDINTNGLGFGEFFSQKAKIPLPDDLDYGSYVSKLSISSDYLAVRYYSANAIYIFQRNENTWSLMTKITPPDDILTGSFFGKSFIVRDNTLFVGVPIINVNDENRTSDGAVYVYIQNENNWVLQTKITPLDNNNKHCFGDTISISANYDLLFIGAPCDNDRADNSGAVYVFKLDGNTWNQQTKISPIGLSTNDYFGSTLSSRDSTALAIGTDTSFIYLLNCRCFNW